MKRRRPGASLVDRLHAKLGPQLARKIGIAEATLKRWLREGPPPGAMERLEAATPQESPQEALERAQRSESSKRGWETRRLDTLRSPGGLKVTDDAGQPILDAHGAPITTPAFDGNSAAGHASLTAMIQDSDPVWQAFLEAAQGIGKTIQEIKSRWYSPKARKATPPKKRKKRKPTKHKPTRKGRKK